MKKEMTQKLLEKEWNQLRRREEKYLRAMEQEGESILSQKLDRVLPARLKQTLEVAFLKAFRLVFDKGTGIIEKTYSKEKKENSYKINQYAHKLNQNKKTLHAFSRQADTGKARNLLLAGVEGIGLGALGIGIGDIPVFTGLMLKSIYEIAMSYGFPYDTDSERYLILHIIRASLAHGPETVLQNRSVDRLLDGSPIPDRWEEEMKQTANALSAAMLYLKFIQGIPLAGVFGGVYDAVYLKRITDYAMIKYKKRFLYGLDRC